MSTPYWEGPKYNDMASVARALEHDPLFADFARYALMRERGRRGEAFVALNLFLASATALDLQTRIKLTDRLLRTSLCTTGFHTLLPQPLMERLILPTLQQWKTADTRASAPRRWLGLHTYNIDELKSALALDPEDDHARARLIDYCLEDAEYATHHLNESLFLGSVEDAEVSLATAESFLADGRNGSYIPALRDEIAELRQMIEDWNEYKLSPDFRQIGFPDWSLGKGRAYRFHRAYYTQTPPEDD